MLKSIATTLNAYLNNYVIWTEPYARHTTKEINNSIFLPLKDENFIVGGSYALKRYTNADWKHDDIDVFVPVYSKTNVPRLESDEDKRLLHEEFQLEVLKLIGKINCPNTTLLKERKVNWLVPGEHSGGEQVDGLINPAEEFHHTLIGTETYRIYDEKVQFVGVILTPGSHGLLNHLLQITDMPSCVFMKPDNATFVIPTNALIPLSSKVIPEKNVCSSRQEKYEKRGYFFY